MDDAVKTLSGGLHQQITDLLVNALTWVDRVIFKNYLTLALSGPPVGRRLTTDRPYVSSFRTY